MLHRRPLILAELLRIVRATGLDLDPDEPPPAPAELRRLVDERALIVWDPQELKRAQGWLDSWRSAELRADPHAATYAEIEVYTALAALLDRALIGIAGEVGLATVPAELLTEN
jgi:hypothetical protein